MNRTFSPPAFHAYAELATGEHVVPGAHPRCPGPDAFGGCPVDDLPSGRPCAGATWLYRDEAQVRWTAQFTTEPSMCPVVLLEPLGPGDTPLD